MPISVHTHFHTKIPFTTNPRTVNLAYSNLKFNNNNPNTFTSPIPDTFPGRRRRRRGSTVRAAAEAVKKDYYSCLNVSRNATLQQIKSSYRKLSRQYHPDMNKDPGAEDKFKEISVAYEVLSDDEKRSLYDRFGEPGLQEHYEGSDLRSQGVDPFEVFDAYFGDSNSFFGGSNFGNSRSESLDIRYDLSLDLKESIFGGQRDIEVLSFDTCDECDGSGAKSSSCIKSCSDCGGRGGVMKSQRTPFGVMSQVSTCLKCGGEGKRITDYCQKCNGDGKMQLKRSIKVVIPPGVNDGATMKVQGEGSFDKKRGRGGDLYLFVHIKEKDGIWRAGLNLCSKITIDYTEAILGTVVKVETVDGLRDLPISPGTQPGDTMKLLSMGVPKLNKPSIRGDHLFIVDVTIPKKISNAERTLVEKLVSLKASSRVDSSHGAPQSHIDKEKIKQNGRPGDVVNDSSFLWSSIRNYLGGRPSATRFASINVEVQKPAQIYCKSEVSVMVPILMILLGTYIMRRIGSYRVLNAQRNTQNLIGRIDGPTYLF